MKIVNVDTKKEAIEVLVQNVWKQLEIPESVTLKDLLYESFFETLPFKNAIEMLMALAADWKDKNESNKQSSKMDAEQSEMMGVIKGEEIHGKTNN